jgi:hypothetical protein
MRALANSAVPLTIVPTSHPVAVPLILALSCRQIGVSRATRLQLRVWL